MIVYKFPIPNFSASEGYTRIVVTNGELILDEEPTSEFEAFIKKYGGDRAELSEEPPAKTKRKVSPVKWSESEEVG